jgi:hypothetical protein
MKRILLLKFAALFTVFLIFNACKKNYISGGTPEDVNRYKNTKTYDVLKTNLLYDTLIQLIDAAGLKDKINEPGTTFFAPSDYSIFHYLNLRTIYVQNNINQNEKFGLDSLVYYLQNNINGTRDSMLIYLIHMPLSFTALTNTGTLYPTELTGDTVVVSYEYTKDGNLGYNPVVSSQPQLVYFTQLWYHFDLSNANPAGNITPDIGVHTLCKTSGITTQNGIINTLENSHTLFFYGTKQ